MKHKHAEMIKAKADNMELILFRKTPTSELWEVCRHDWMPTDLQDEFYLCLPQHKEACKHWLNGGTTEQWCNTIWLALDSYAEDPAWYKDEDFMDEEFKVRIKPPKQKRWIIYNLDKDCIEQVFHNDASGFHDPSFRHSMHEIEVDI